MEQQTKKSELLVGVIVTARFIDRYTMLQD